MKKIKIEVKTMPYANSFYYVGKEAEFDIDDQDIDSFFKLVENLAKIKTESILDVQTCPYKNPQQRTFKFVRCKEHGEIWFCIGNVTN